MTDNAPAADPAPEPNHGFENSRRLTGPNRYFGGPAVTLTPLGRAAQDPVALGFWADQVRLLCATLGWPDPQPLAVRHGTGTLLVFSAPQDVLLTATEINEWAWERAAAASGESAFDLAHDFAATAAAAEFAARAAAEPVPGLGALRAAAALHAVPLFEDDETVSLGGGAGSCMWLRDALPVPDAVSWPALYDVPTALVTGSNGKTTTVRLLAAMAAAAGLTPGLCSTEGVFVGGRLVAQGDYSGPEGARAVLRHPLVHAAILETARGGILRRGLAVQRADVAVVTNISADHFGEYGVEDADGLAETKLVVARAASRGTLVLNADDTTVMAAAARLPYTAAPRRALFALAHTHPALVALRERGGSTCAVHDGRLLLHHEGSDRPLGDIRELPLTFGGAAPYNIGNLAAAALAASALGFPAQAIDDTLRRFGTAPQDNPGRLERWQFRGALVLIDYAHNPDALDHLLRVARAFNPARLLLLLGQAGNRDDGAIAELARTAARFAPDRVMLKELSLMLRGRAPGEVPALLGDALSKAGIAPERICVEPDEEAAAVGLLDAATPGDVIVLPIHTRAVRERLRSKLQSK